MSSFIKKDLLLFWRERKEILIVFVMPLLSIIILSIAFTSLFGGNSKPLKIDLAIVHEDNESLGLEQFERTVRTMEWSQSKKETIIQRAAIFSPSQLMNEFFQSSELKDLVHTKELSEEKAVEKVKNGDVDALIKIPKGFTYQVLCSIFLNQKSETPIILNVKKQAMEVDMLQTIVGSYMDSLNFQFALNRVDDSAAVKPLLPHGGIEVLEDANILSSSQSFTISMSLLFALFIASFIAVKTMAEKRERVISRILLSNRHPFSFLISKAVASSILAWFQLFLIFIIAHLILDVFSGKSFVFWMGIILVITTFSLAVGGLTAMFASVSLRLNTSDEASGLFMVIIMVMAVVGGNFSSIFAFPKWMEQIGEWTPNGLTQLMLIEWVQYGNMESLILPIMLVLVMGVALLLIGMFLFPRRGRI
jgi:ABC-2 type transport system permease protein